jgi:hypothetical protein
VKDPTGSVWQSLGVEHDVCHPPLYVKVCWTCPTGVVSTETEAAAFTGALLAAHEGSNMPTKATLTAMEAFNR